MSNIFVSKTRLEQAKHHDKLVALPLQSIKGTKANEGAAKK